MQLRSPYPDARRMAALGDQEVQPEEVVDVPDDLVESFKAAGWRGPGEPIVWPPVPYRPDEPDAKTKTPPVPTPPPTGGATAAKES